MNIQDYILTQNTLNKALHKGTDARRDFALFAAIFGEQIDSLREHIEDGDDAPVSDFLNGIKSDTRPHYHLKAEDKDFEVTNALNVALGAQQLMRFNLIMSQQSHPLSMHNDAKHIEDDVLLNCPFATQQRLKSMQSKNFDEKDDYSGNNQRPAMLYDIIQQTHQQFETL